VVARDTVETSNARNARRVQREMIFQMVLRGGARATQDGGSQQFVWRDPSMRCDDDKFIFASFTLELFGGSDGTRTRGLLCDRHAF
jgi:hypothetical protein